MSYFMPNDRVVFQGDSITNAFCKLDEVGISYRLGSGWAMIVAAKLMAEYPELNLNFENRGVCGEGPAELNVRWQSDCLDLKPTVLNLLIGVNDTRNLLLYGKPRPLNVFRDQVRSLLDQSRTALPEVRIILCEPFLLEMNEITTAWREDLGMRQEVIRSIAHEYNATFVPLQDAFDKAAAENNNAHWLFDGIHPNAAGQWLISKQWLSTLGYS